jgi:hypothetical protein
MNFIANRLILLVLRHSTLIINNSLHSVLHGPFSTLLSTPNDAVNLLQRQLCPLNFYGRFKLFLGFLLMLPYTAL